MNLAKTVAGESALDVVVLAFRGVDVLHVHEVGVDGEPVYQGLPLHLAGQPDVANAFFARFT